jgi:FkbM family methyltransferase
MRARPPRLHNRLFSLVRRLYRGSAGLRSKNAVRLALDVLEANGNPEITVTDRHDFQVSLATADKVISASILRKGHFDGEVCEAVAAVVSQQGLGAADLLFVSAGANIGTSCLNAYALGFRRMVAVEPDPGNFRLLARNVARLENADVKLCNVALGDRSHSATLHRHRSNFGGHSLRLLSRGQAANGEAIEVLPLTAVLPDGEPFILILDVEGLEPAAIRGARELLLEQCRVLCLELAPSRYTEEDRRYLAAFAETFATSFLHLPSGEWRPIARLAETMASQRKAYVDVVMVNRAAARERP